MGSRFAIPYQNAFSAILSELVLVGYELLREAVWAVVEALE